MNHRRHKAMRFVKLLWITSEPRRALVFYLINTPLPKSGFLACISSRITTVIQVVRYYQINDNWFNEPFAVSRYILLILRHAWLNLWDKHMTTGRINQVTILTPQPWGVGDPPPRQGKVLRDSGLQGLVSRRWSSTVSYATRYRAKATGARSRGYNGFRLPIHLPPLSSPPHGPPHAVGRLGPPGCDMCASGGGFSPPDLP